MLWGLQAIITVIEIAGSFVWVRMFYPERKEDLIHRAVYVAGVVLAIGLTIMQRNMVMYSRYYLLICIALCSLICFCRFGCRARYLFMMAFYYESIYCLDLVLSILVGIFTDNPYFMSEQLNVLRINRIIIYLLARCIAAVIFCVVYSLKDKFTFFLLEKWIYVIPPFEHLILIGCDIALSPGMEKRAWLRIKIFFVVCLLLILILIAFYIYSMKKSISELVEMQKSLYAQSYENITLRRMERERLYHDMKNHLLAIHGMAQSGQLEQLENYVDRLYDPLDKIQEYTGNLLVDYLISEKIAYAEKCGIAVELDCGGLMQSDNGQEDMDWTAILGNLWDNAIESCERCTGEKQIRFDIAQKGNIVLIHMENSCLASTKRTGLATLKNPNEMHGIGMLSVRYVISKYNGSLDWKCFRERFITDITMYMQ